MAEKSSRQLHIEASIKSWLKEQRWLEWKIEPDGDLIAYIDGSGYDFSYLAKIIDQDLSV